MTRITVSIEVKETVDPAKLGLWLEAWLRNQWDGHGEHVVRQRRDEHLAAVERACATCDCGWCA